MAFNATAFMKAQFEPRTAQIAVPSMADFFDADDQPIFVVRGLTANEIAKANEATAKNRGIDSMLTVLETATQSEQIKLIRDQLGLNKANEDEIVKRLEHLVCASISPSVSLQVAVKLANAYPIEFFTLTNKIASLTGEGQQVVKKLNSSGNCPE